MKTLDLWSVGCATMLVAFGLTLSKPHSHTVPSNVMGKALFVPSTGVEEKKGDIPGLRLCRLYEISKESLSNHFAHQLKTLGRVVVIASDGVCTVRFGPSLDDGPAIITYDFIRGETGGDVAMAHTLIMSEGYTNAGCEGEDHFYFAQIIEEAAP